MADYDIIKAMESLEDDGWECDFGETPSAKCTHHESGVSVGIVEAEELVESQRRRF